MEIISSNVSYVNLINFYNRSILTFKKISFYYFKNEKQTWYFKIKNILKTNKCQVAGLGQTLRATYILRVLDFNKSSARLCVPRRMSSVNFLNVNYCLM